MQTTTRTRICQLARVDRGQRVVPAMMRWENAVTYFLIVQFVVDIILIWKLMDLVAAAR